MKDIIFESMKAKHKPIIFEWLEEEHVKSFWDNSIEHKEDILNFINNKVQTYYDGKTTYWVGFANNVPYCFLASSIITKQSFSPQLWLNHISNTGNTISIDYFIGNKDYLGQGYGSITLEKFMQFYKSTIDPKTDQFFIDPARNNPRAKHVYEKSGFKFIGSNTIEHGYFKGQIFDLMVKKI